MPVASSSRQRFADGLIAFRGVCGRASDRGAALSFGWNFHRAALSGSPAVLFNAVLPGPEADSEPPSWEGTDKQPAAA